MITDTYFGCRVLKLQQSNLCPVDKKTALDTECTKCLFIADYYFNDYGKKYIVRKVIVF